MFYIGQFRFIIQMICYISQTENNTITIWIDLLDFTQSQRL